MARGKNNTKVPETSEKEKCSQSEEDKSKDSEIFVDEHQQLNDTDIIKKSQLHADCKLIKSQSSDNSETIFPDKNSELPQIDEDKKSPLAQTTDGNHNKIELSQMIHDIIPELNENQNKDISVHFKKTSDTPPAGDIVINKKKHKQPQETDKIINQTLQQNEFAIASIPNESNKNNEEIFEQKEPSQEVQPDEEKDANRVGFDDSVSKKDRISGTKTKKKRPNQGNSLNHNNQTTSHKVIERKRGIRDLPAEEKWSVFERYEILQSLRGVGREFNMDHSTVKLLLLRIRHEQPPGEIITKEMFLQGDLAKQGHGPVITKKHKKELLKAAKNQVNFEHHYSEDDQIEGQVHLFDQDLNASDGNINEGVIKKTKKQKKQKIEQKEEQEEIYYEDGIEAIQNEEVLLVDAKPLINLHTSKSRNKLSDEEKEQRKEQRNQKRIMKQDEKVLKKKSKGKSTLGEIGNVLSGDPLGEQSQFPNQQLNNVSANSQNQQVNQNHFMETGNDDIHNIFSGFYQNHQTFSGGQVQSGQSQYAYDQNISGEQQHLPYSFFCDNNHNQQLQQDDFDLIIDNIDIHEKNIIMTQENHCKNNSQNGHNFDNDINLEFS